jgi:TolB protein
MPGRRCVTLSISMFLSIALSIGGLEAQELQLQVTRQTAVRDMYPFWSPDGRQIVFQSDRNAQMLGQDQIYIMNADGTQVRRLTHSTSSDEAPVWSPDGSTILFSSYITDENSELYTINTDGSGLRRLTDNPGRDGHAKFSPDGERIIFCSIRNGSEVYDLYEMDLDGQDITRLTQYNGWDTYPAISPDGSRIAWRRILPTGGTSSTGHNSEIFVMNRDGSNPTNVSHHPDFDGYPAWSPDGLKIVFASNRARKNDFRGNFHLYVMNPDGSDVHQLLDNAGTVEDARPIWSPDGKKILFNRQYVADESSIDILTILLPEELWAVPE